MGVLLLSRGMNGVYRVVSCHPVSTFDTALYVESLRKRVIDPWVCQVCQRFRVTLVRVFLR